MAAPPLVQARKITNTIIQLETRYFIVKYPGSKTGFTNDKDRANKVLKLERDTADNAADVKWSLVEELNQQYGTQNHKDGPEITTDGIWWVTEGCMSK
tara:strand:- start:284 stop:577 length:294 start_codon:yes stop_codon:yes gene_type:complete